MISKFITSPIMVSLLISTCALSEAKATSGPQQTAEALIRSCSAGSKNQTPKPGCAESYFNFSAIAQAALGQHKTVLGETRYKTLVASFEKILRKRVRDASTALGAARMLSSEQEAASDRTKLFIHDNQANEDRQFSLLWREAKANAWKVVDIDVEGASIVLDYRNQFSRILKKDGASALAKKIEAQANKGSRAK